jgi:hypothetical protein
MLSPQEAEESVMSKLDVKVMNVWFVLLFAYGCWREVRSQTRPE